jgi:uncharacterized SAM-binding protein YcdF (DUF218 family)
MSGRRGCACGCATPAIILFALLGIATAIFHVQLLTALGQWLVLSESPQKADAAVAMAGDDYGERVIAAGQLVRDGWVPYALINGTPFLGTNHAELTIAYAVEKGYPRSYFKPFERDMVATRDETETVARYLQENGIRKILLVTSNYHTRRTAFLMRRAAPWLQFRMVAAPDKSFSPDSWWKTRAGQRTLFLEWSKTISAHLGN